MIETELKKLTAAVEANTAALLNGAPAVNVAETPSPIPADKQPVVPPTNETAIDDGAVGAAAKPVERTEITKAIIALCKVKPREIGAAILAKYGAVKVPDLKDESKYAEILADITAALES